jgi:DNA mismatch repair protein MutH
VVGAKMTEVKYDKTSVDSIFNFAKELTGKSLAEACFIPASIANAKNRGDLGSLVETFYFEHKPPSNKGPDFPEAGLELKTTGVIKSKEGKFKPKERLVLTMIDFEGIVDEVWETSSFLSKCKLMLILFYLYEKERPVVDRRFVLDPLLYRIDEHDLEVIKRDWQLIREKVRQGRAHELSEGDTNYLGACRKGSGGASEPLRNQPFSEKKAKARAFSFKSSYVAQIMNGNQASKSVLDIGPAMTFEEAVANKFSSFIGKSISDISESFSIRKKDKNQKGFHRQLAVKMLSNGGHTVPELEKAGIELKTIRLGKNGKPRESMSFPGFKFLEIVNEKWEDSKFFEKIEQKFLFIVFAPNQYGDEVFKGAVLWNMPYEDRLEAKRVWENTKRRVALDATDLPRITESRVAHVRPKGKDGKDKIPTPQGGMHLKQCFWLNAEYIHSQISRISLSESDET